MLRRSLRALRRVDAAVGAAAAPQWLLQTIRPFAQVAQEYQVDPELKKLRNIGISAHIDSGKTTLTERILFYTGRIHEIHEVRGKDGVGAKMDSMELEREKGITIKSAATYCSWKDSKINIIDTPGHVDFTIEVERSLRVLDGAILVLCGVGGVQSQSITVDRQMKRYDVPRVAFINKLDRVGADPWRVVGMARAERQRTGFASHYINYIKLVRDKLKCNCSPVQIPMGLEDQLEGVVDIVRRKAVYFEGENGEKIVHKDVPEKYKEQMEAKRHELVEKVAEVDEELAELYLGGEDIPAEKLIPAIRRAALALKFTPVFLGSAYKNKKASNALDLDKDEAPLTLAPSAKAPLVALAFKLEEGRFGQLTYMRIYQGTLRKGNNIVNTSNGKRVKVPRLVRMHSDDMEDVDSIGPGEIGALFGVECASGDTFTDGSVNVAMTSMRVPEPVMSLAVAPKSRDAGAAFSKALNRFQKEDPTFRVSVDSESGQTIISGMGELHLEVYVERMRREYKVECEVGKPRVNYREAITRGAEFDYLHKKQSGGQGQYGRVVGRIEPLPEGSAENFEFVNGMVGSAISPGFIAAIEKGFREAVQSGGLTGHPVDNVRVTLTDGASHAVDSSELAFKIAALNAFRQAFDEAGPTVLEPVMKVEITIPVEYQGAIVGSVNRRKGVILNSEQQADDVVLFAEVPLNNMFGYSTELRSMTQGKGEFTMEYERHAAVTQDALAELTKLYGRGGALSKIGK